MRAILLLVSVVFAYLDEDHDHHRKSVMDVIGAHIEDDADKPPAGWVPQSWGGEDEDHKMLYVHMRTKFIATHPHSQIKESGTVTGG